MVSDIKVEKKSNTAVSSLIFCEEGAVPSSNDNEVTILNMELDCQKQINNRLKKMISHLTKSMNA